MCPSFPSNYAQIWIMVMGSLLGAGDQVGGPFGYSSGDPGRPELTVPWEFTGTTASGSKGGWYTGRLEL